MLINLEKSLQEVYEMFVQISTFVMEQGSLIQVKEGADDSITIY